MIERIAPGSTIGVLGGGQLGRMFGIAARRLGYRVHTYEASPDSPAGQISDREFTGSYTDEAAIAEFVDSVDVITFEFEADSSSIGSPSYLPEPGARKSLSARQWLSDCVVPGRWK